MKSRLECIVTLGMAQIDAAVQHAIWKHCTFSQYIGYETDTGGLYPLLAVKPHWPERCPDCDCHPLTPTTQISPRD